MKMNRSVVSFILVLAIIVVIVPTLAIASIYMNGDRSRVNVVIDGRAVLFPDQLPIIVEGRTLIPIDSVFEIMGFDVQWDEETQQVTLVDDCVVIITNGLHTFYVNGAEYELCVPAQIVGDRMMLPIRAVLESAGYHVDWRHSTRTILISTTVVETIAGTGRHGFADGTNAVFNIPGGIFGRGDGEVYVADTYNNLIRRIDNTGYVHTLAGTVLALDEIGFPRGALIDGDTASALFNRPLSGVFDNLGRLFVADSLNHTIRVIENEQVYTFAGSEVAGHVDGSAHNARFNHPSAVASDPHGNIFVADTQNHVIRRIAANGTVTTVAGVPGTSGHRDGGRESALFSYPMGIAVSNDGRIFVADTGNHLIRMIDGTRVTTVAGRLSSPYDVDPEEYGDFDYVPLGGFADGNDAMFNQPTDVAIWRDMIIVADSVNHRIRAVLPTGETITIAGSGLADHVDGPSLNAAFHLPQGVYVNGDMLYVSDTGNNLIRQFLLER